ncbi:MAG TPA: type IV toxin-antitoxin system AbiEi family antitoxin domain-containing protein, partial [Acidimicrobiia bacterium]|nr:type IV toxin-antitoxin system AbiEi family antitoxin domain-containing protein [Acidimicrobiia bacterium]
MGKFDDQMLRLASRQHLVVSRPQLLELGSRDQITRRLKSGVLETRFQGSYRLAGSPRTWK